jgi:hypothetical protein
MRDEASPAGEERPDPTQPYITKIGEAPSAEPSTTTTGKKSATGGSAPKDTGGGKNVVSRSDCDRVMDKYLELEIATNRQLEGVPPEVIEQAKRMAREKHGDAPCTATHAQYTCAMAATSTDAWQRCMR